MKINLSTLHTFVDNLHGISIPTALIILHRHWCGPMVVRGFCTEECSTCGDHLHNAFQFENARKPEALLVWMLKNELAAVQEETHVHEFVPLQDAFGLPIPESQDIFGDLAKRYK
jgi:hypothetical protein